MGGKLLYQQRLKRPKNQQCWDCEEILVWTCETFCSVSYHSQYYRRNRLVFIVIKKKMEKGKSRRNEKSEYASLFFKKKVKLELYLIFKSLPVRTSSLLRGFLFYWLKQETTPDCQNQKSSKYFCQAGASFSLLSRERCAFVRMKYTSQCYFFLFI